MAATNGDAEDALSRVREGMEVVDRSGERLGIVELVARGTPGATATPAREEGVPGTVYEYLVRAIFGPEPRIPDELVARLTQRGFVKIDGIGVLGRDAYAGAEQIGDVDGATVRLTVTKADLIYAV